MHPGNQDRLPTSSIILFASILFSLTAYVVFRVLWKVPVPVPLLAAVLGIQFAALLLGGSKVLTRLGAVSLSGLAGVGASVAAVVLLFPPTRELKLAGSVGAGSALVFILASFVAASRADPVPGKHDGSLDLPEPQEGETLELVRYGEPSGTGGQEEFDPAADPGLEIERNDDRAADSNMVEELMVPDDKVYEFDGLSDEFLENALGGSDEPPATDEAPDPERFPGPGEAAAAEEPLFPDEKTEVQTAPDEEIRLPDLAEVQAVDAEEPLIPDDWVEETAKAMAYEGSEEEKDEDSGGHGSAEEGHETVPEGLGGAGGLDLRPRFKVLHSTTGEHYGTFYSDRGYSTLDPVSLMGLLGSRLPEGELRIAKLDWSNFDEVEVHITVEEHQPPDRPVAQEKFPDEASEYFAMRKEPRYMIYDRRTIQPLGEYVPEGDRPRIDRLTLYRMFPEYNFKTFEIDSVRWEDDEVRILIRGEKKKGPD